MDKKHPIENMMSLPSEGPRIVEVSGQSVFPVVEDSAECAIFIEYNGYRKQVNFPIKPAVPGKKEPEKPSSSGRS